MISTEKGGYISVGAKVTGQVVDLKSNSLASEGAIAEVYDSVLFYHSQCYSYQVNLAD